MRKLLFIILLVLLSACSTDTETDTEKEYLIEPDIPGGQIGNLDDIRNPYDVQFIMDDYNQVKITWKVPHLYETEDWQVVIYRVESDKYETEIEINDPKTELGAGDFELIRLTAYEYLDTDVYQNQSYHYWVFLNLNGSEWHRGSEGYWSSSPRYEVFTPLQTSETFFPSYDKFWESIRWSDFIFPEWSMTNYNTMKEPTSSADSPVGGMSIGYSGSLMFTADTLNNRILVFENSSIRICEQFIDDDLQYYACRIQASGEKPTIKNIIGQPDQHSSLTCSEHNIECLANIAESSCLDAKNGFCRWDSDSNICKVDGSKCLTSPTSVLIDNNKLLISDSGNHRIVIHPEIFFDGPSGSASIEDKLLIGCDPEIIPLRVIPTRCAASRVIGRQGLNDLESNYQIIFDGMSSLDYPTGMVIRDEDLFIADTRNNRVVKISNFDDIDFFYCTDMFDLSQAQTWKTPLCSFSAVLGQPSFTENETFTDFFNADPAILSGIFSNKLEDSPTLLSKYFRNPTQLMFFEYVNIQLRESLRLENKWNSYIRDAILDNNGELDQIPEISDSTKAIYNSRDKVIHEKLLIGTDEDFEAIAGLGTNVALKGRILVFEPETIVGSAPTCNSATFLNNGCSAVDVLGQSSFDQIILVSGMSGGSGEYSNLTYAIESIGGMTMMGNKLLVTDYIQNSIYIYEDFPEKNSNNGWAHNGAVLNPNGKYINATIGSLPTLENLTDLYWDDSSSKLYLIDTAIPQIFQVDLDLPVYE